MVLSKSGANVVVKEHHLAPVSLAPSVSSRTSGTLSASPHKLLVFSFFRKTADIQEPFSGIFDTFFSSSGVLELGKKSSM